MLPTFQVKALSTSSIFTPAATVTATFTMRPVPLDLHRGCLHPEAGPVPLDLAVQEALHVPVVLERRNAAGEKLSGYQKT